MSQKITRRQFLTFAAMGIGSTVLTCGGLGAIALRPPEVSYYRKLAATRDPANPAVLVTYASKAGSTIGIAQAIASELEKRCFTVDISPVNRVTDLKGYHYVVIGSAIRMSAPLPEVVNFVEQNRDKLASIPTAFFAVYLMNSANDEVSSKARLGYIDPIRNLLPIQHEAFFTGVFDPKKVSFIEGLMGKMMNSPIGDFRDWEAISKWGELLFTA
jgi:menaquinone-dependent protoporphyrinogen oxidase